MEVLGYPHEIEYRRERAKDRRDHVYTELADDMGFCLEHHKDRRESWLACYAKACATDYLTRVHAERGTWLVTVYRVHPNSRDHVITIRLRHPSVGP